MPKNKQSGGKCPKVKNPCKICLETVTQKNGLQCCGACENWVHYGCLNYTPGRINDIKAGIIKVTCPCPDCKTTVPKEFRTDEPFSCTNLQCPANKPPQCDNMKCPANATQTSGCNMPPPCPLSKCGKTDCKQHANPTSCPPQLPCSAMSQLPPMNQMPINPLAMNQMPINQLAMNQMPLMSTSDACIDFNKCPSGCLPNFPGDNNMQMAGMGGMAGMGAIAGMGGLAGMAAMGGMGGGGMVSCPPNQQGMNEMPSMMVMEQMCNTVGLLSKQINELMMKMQQNTRGKGNPCKTCAQKGAKSDCPKPCYCPDNPGQQ